MLTLALTAFAAGFLLGRFTVRSGARPPRWAVTRDGGSWLVCWTQPRPDGRTTFIGGPRLMGPQSARALARLLNRGGHTPATLDAAFARPEGGRA